MTSRTKKAADAIRYLQLSEDKILTYLKKVVAAKDFSYRTFGTAIEEHLTDAIVILLTEGGFIKSTDDYSVSPNKNYFPDFELKTKPSLAIEFKSGNRSQFRGGKWVRVKNSENDLGTLNEWPKKIEKFGGDAICYIFVLYNFNDVEREVVRVTVAPFYQFVGLNSDNVLKYREKDGNVRPKDFDSEPPIKTLRQFIELLHATIVYRSKRIIKRHRLIIKKANERAKKESD